MGTLERLDHCMNVIGLTMVIFGGILSIWSATAGNTILSAGVGVLGNSAVRAVAGRMIDTTTSTTVTTNDPATKTAAQTVGVVSPKA